MDENYAQETVQDMEKCKNYLVTLGEYITTIEDMKVQRGLVEMSVLFFNGALQRQYELSTNAYECLTRKRVIPAAVLTRAATETMALMLVTVQEVKTAIEAEDMKRLVERLQPMAFGGKLKSARFPAINVLTYIDKASQHVPGWREYYEQLSEYAHPNMYGVIGAYVKFDKDYQGASFGLSQGSNADFATYLCPKLLRVCLARAVTQTVDFLQLVPTLKDLAIKQGLSS